MRTADSQDSLETARTLRREGNQIFACALLERIIESDAPFGEAYYELGLSLAARGRLSDAQRRLNQARELHYKEPESIDALGMVCARIKVAEIEAKLKSAEESIEEYEAVTKLYPNSIHTRLAIGEAWEKCGDVAKARMAYLEALDIDSSDSTAHSRIRSILNSDVEGDVRERLERLAESNSANGANITWAITLLTLGSTDRVMMLLKAVSDDNDAKTHLDPFEYPQLANAIQASDGSSIFLVALRNAISTVADPELHARWGYEFTRLEFVEYAAEEFDIAMKSSSGFLEAMKWIDLVSESGSEVGKSLLKRMRNKRSAHARNRIGIILASMGQVSDAEREFTRAARTKRMAPVAWTNLGTLQLNKGNSQEASGLFFRAIKEMSKLGGKFSDGEYLHGANPWSGFLSTLDESTESQVSEIHQFALVAKSATILVVSAQILVGKGRHDEGLAILKKAVANDPEYWEADYQFADLFLATGRVKDAVEPLCRLLQNNYYRGEDILTRHKDAIRGDEAAVQAIHEFVHSTSDAAIYSRWAGFLADSGDHRRSVAVFEYALEAGCDPSQVDYGKWLEVLRLLDREEGVICKLVNLLPDGVPSAMNECKWAEIKEKQRDQTKRLDQVIDAIRRHVDAQWSLRGYAQTLASVGQTPQAVNLLRVAHQLDSCDAATNNALGFYLWRLDRNRQALNYLERSVQLKDEGWTHYNLARVYVSLFEYQNAFAEIDKARLSGEFETGDLRTLLEYYSRILAETGDNEKALQLAKECLEIEDAGRSFWIHFRIASILDNLMRYTDAAEEYQRAIQDYSPEEPYEYAAYVNHNIASGLNFQGRFRDAWNSWPEALKLYASDVKRAVRERNQEFLANYGIALRYGLGDLDAAEAAFRMGLVLDPYSVPIRIALADLYVRRHDAARGRENIEKRRTTWWSRWRSNVLRSPNCEIADAASAWTEQSRIIQVCVEAKSLVNEVLEDDKNDVGALMRLAKLHMVAREYKEAQAALTKVLKIAPEAEGIHEKLAQVYAREGGSKNDLSVPSYRAALAKSPGNLVLQTQLGRVLLAKEDLENAEVEYQRVLETAHFHVDALIGLAEVYIGMAEQRAKSADTRQARTLLEHAIELLNQGIDVAAPDAQDRPQNYISVERAPAFYLRGYARVQLYELGGQFRDRFELREARNDFEKCHVLDPEHNKAHRANKRVQDALTKRIEHSILGTVVPWVITLVSISALALSVTWYTNGRPVLVATPFQLTTESFDTLAKRVAVLNENGTSEQKAIGAAVLKATIPLKNIENVPFTDMKALDRTIGAVVGPDLAPDVRKEILASVIGGEAKIEQKTLGDMAFVSMFSIALLFMVVGAYLPQLTTLKVGGIQLEKGAGESLTSGERPVVQRLSLEKPG